MDRTNNLQTIHFLVSGRVQGVSFRAESQAIACKLGLTGWVKNTVDGRVEGVATGTAKQIKDLQLWLKQGPPLAEVVDLQIQQIDLLKFNSFEIVF